MIKICACGRTACIVAHSKSKCIPKCGECYSKFLKEENQSTKSYVEEQLKIVSQFAFDEVDAKNSQKVILGKLEAALGPEFIDHLYKVKTKSEVERILRPYKTGQIVLSI